MADTKIADLTALTSVASNDVVPIVDVSDTTDSSNGSTKKITQANLVADRAPIASPTFTGTVTIPLNPTLGSVTLTVTGTELNFVAGVTSAIQTQLNNKQTLNTNLTVIGGLADPNADRILFWDDSAGAYAYLTAGTGLTISGTTITASTSSNTFKTVSVSGQSDVVADSSTDTLTLVAGAGLTITTDAFTDTVTLTPALPLIGGLVKESVIGTKDGANTTFTTGHTPVFLTINGQINVSGDGYTSSGLTHTFSPAPQATDILYCFYNAIIPNPALSGGGNYLGLLGGLTY